MLASSSPVDDDSVKDIVKDQLAVIKPEALQDAMTQALVDKLVNDYSFHSAVVTAVSAELGRRYDRREN